YRRFTEALDSFKDIVRAELRLIDLDAELKAKQENLSGEEQLEFAVKEKEVFLTGLREKLEALIWETGDMDRWNRVKEARAEQFEAHAQLLRSTLEEVRTAKAAAAIQSDAAAPSAAAALSIPRNGGIGRCPPG